MSTCTGEHKESRELKNLSSGLCWLWGAEEGTGGGSGPDVGTGRGCSALGNVGHLVLMDN